MNIEQALKAFPAKSPFRSILPDLLDENEAVWEAAHERLRDLDRVAVGDDRLARTWNYSEAEALGILRAAIGLPFAPARAEWKDAVHDLISLLLRCPYKSLVGPAREAYPTVSDRSKCAILALLGACGSIDAAKALKSCIRDHGWPNHVYDRVFWEMAKLLSHASILFPELIERAGENIGPVANVFVAAIAQGHLDLANSHCLRPLAQLVSQRLSECLEVVSQLQRDKGIAWRFTEQYWPARHQTGAWLDIAGYLKDLAPVALLEEALRLGDPRLAAFAVSSVLRCGGSIGDGVLERIAACHETRALLFQLLQNHGKLELFPQTFRTWDAFAAANMVNWLMYPTELGREPDYLEKMAVFTSTKTDGELVLYVWRFRNGDDSWFAGVSGPYLFEGTPCPLHGDMTFSCFEKWDDASAEKHAEETLKTLNEWKNARRG